MLYFVLIVLGVLFGILAGGKLTNLLDLKFKKAYLIFLVFAIHSITRIMCYNGFEFFIKNTFYIQAVVFCILFAVFWFNRHYVGVIIIGLGSLLNTIVIMMNGGRMPVSQNILLKAGMEETIDLLINGFDAKHTIINESTRAVFLADVIYLPGFLGLMMRVISIGDLIIAAGVFMVFFQVVSDINIKQISFFSLRR